MGFLCCILIKIPEQLAMTWTHCFGKALFFFILLCLTVLLRPILGYLFKFWCSNPPTCPLVHGLGLWVWGGAFKGALEQAQVRLLFLLPPTISRVWECPGLEFGRASSKESGYKILTLPWLMCFKRVRKSNGVRKDEWFQIMSRWELISCNCWINVISTQGL